MIEDISKYLKKFDARIGEGIKEKELLKLVIKELCHIEIKSEDIEIRESEAQLKISPVKKTEIYIKKDKILALLQERGSVIKTIR